MAIDWSKAPDEAEFYGCGYFFREKNGKLYIYYDSKGWVGSSLLSKDMVRIHSDYCERPQQWPETDDRIDVIGSNGNTAEHYEEVVPFIEWSKAGELAKPSHPKTAVEFLNACAAVQSERGKQYDASGTGERSFAAAASAFNAATGKSLTGSDVCLLLTMVKLVRQYSSPGRLHHDSLLDGVSYLSLWAEELTKELSE